MTVPLDSLFAPAHHTAPAVFGGVNLFNRLTAFERILVDLFACLVLLIVLALFWYLVARLTPRWPRGLVPQQHHHVRNTFVG